MQEFTIIFSRHYNAWPWSYIALSMLVIIKRYDQESRSATAIWCFSVQQVFQMKWHNVPVSFNMTLVLIPVAAGRHHSSAWLCWVLVGNRKQGKKIGIYVSISWGRPHWGSTVAWWLILRDRGSWCSGKFQCNMTGILIITGVFSRDTWMSKMFVSCWGDGYKRHHFCAK